MKTLIALIVLLCSCISTDVSDDITVSVDINAAGALDVNSITHITQVIDIHDVTYVATRTLNVSDKLKNLDDKFGANYTVSVSSNTLTTLSSTFIDVQRFSVQLVSDTNKLAVVDHTMTIEERSDTSINIIPDVPGTDIKNMLALGSTQIIVTVVGSLTGTVPTKYNDTIVIHVAAHVSKSL